MIRDKRILKTFKLVVICLMGLIFNQPLLATQTVLGPCTDCHLCDNPTDEEPCIKECLRQTHKIYSQNKTKNLPGMIQLGKTGNLYEPVMFDHKIHASMGDMGKGCLECHHYSSSKRIPPCRECHTNPKLLGQPGLKGAYHRQCMDCHRSWSHSTACVNCHVPTVEGDKNLKQITAHSNLSFQTHLDKPVMKIYDTPYKKGKLVTFYHNEHADLYGLECVDCHQRETCANCHDKDQHTTVTKSEEEIHNLCNACHKNDNCQKCHDSDKKQPFTHNSAKWRLSMYHEELVCNDCHITGKRIKSFSGNCVDCHMFSESKSFSHSVTGLELDDVHSEFSCDDCHVDQNYHTSRECSSCHDDNRTAEKEAPGKRILISALIEALTNNEEVH